MVFIAKSRAGMVEAEMMGVISFLETIWREDILDHHFEVGENCIVDGEVGVHLDFPRTVQVCSLCRTLYKLPRIRCYNM
jgi:hypothetical protein